MDHVVYLDSKANEHDLLLSGKKKMIIRGAAGRKMPYGRVNQNDNLYFINNNGEGVILSKALVSVVINSEKMTEDESIQLVNNHAKELQLSKSQYSRWAGKRYLVLIGTKEMEEIEPFQIDKSGYGNMDDWLLVQKIDDVRINH